MSGTTSPPNPYNWEGKLIHVGTPGIFHRFGWPLDLTRTRCGRDATDARATDHRLEDYQPCVVCWPDYHEATE